MERKIAIVGHGFHSRIVSAILESQNQDVIMLDSQLTQPTEVYEYKSYSTPIELFTPPLTRKERRAKERQNKKNRP